MAEKTRTDIFNLKAIEDKLPEGMNNKKQKLTTLFNGVSFYSKPEDIDRIIKVIKSESAKSIKELEKLKK